MSAEWAIFDIVERMLARQGRTKQWADGAFASAELNGVALSTDGASKKVVLDELTLFSGASSAANYYNIYGTRQGTQEIGDIGTRTIDTVDINLQTFGSTFPGVVIEVQEGDDDGPGGTVVGSSITIPAGSIVAGWNNGVAVNASLVNGKKYFLVVRASGEAGDGSNYIRLGWNNHVYLKGASFYTTDGSTWVETANSNLLFELNVTKPTLGSVVQSITDTSLGKFLNAYHTVVANDGAITVDIENSSGVNLSADVADGADLTGITNPEQNTTFQLKANLSRTLVTDASPELKWWGISYIGDTTA